MKDYSLYHLMKINNLIKCDIKMNLKNGVKDNRYQNRF